MTYLGPSPLWREIADSMAKAATNIETFREPSDNAFRLAHWAPNEPTFRWFKSYLQILASNMSAFEHELYERLGDTRMGNPLEVEVEVTAAGSRLTVNLDYVLAVEEAYFLERFLPHSPRTVIEIGAGFGRTAHTLMTNFHTIESYGIIDLPQTLALSREFLSRVLDVEAFRRITFIDSTSSAELPTEKADLVIQIDGFQEMNDDTISMYYESQIDQSRFTYLCQPVGKYDPAAAGISNPNPKQYAATQELGRTKVQVDPWVESSVANARALHVRNYLPQGWNELISVPSRARPYYLHTLYQRPSAVD